MLQPGLCQSLPKFRIGDQLGDGFGKRARIVRSVHDAVHTGSHELGRAAVATGDYRPAAGHGFDDHASEGFWPGAGVDDYIQRTHGGCAIHDLSGEADVIGDSQFAGQTAERFE